MAKTNIVPKSPNIAPDAPTEMPCENIALKADAIIPLTKYITRYLVFPYTLSTSGPTALEHTY
jgi:hypothetical protein